MQENQSLKQGLGTAAEAMAYLRISRTTLWRLERAGVLRPVRIGRAIRYNWRDLHRVAGAGAGEGGAA